MLRVRITYSSYDNESGRDHPPEERTRDESIFGWDDLPQLLMDIEEGGTCTILKIEVL
jgi:hypothetical protein